MRKIRIGIMGCAAIAKKSIIPAILELSEQFELVAIASRSIEKASEFASAFNCKPVEGYDSLLEEDVDAVYIPLPTGLHDEWINKSLKAGKHVYAEKSIANSFEGAKTMVANAKENGVALMEGYMFQYHSQHQAVKSLLKENAIGELRSFRGSFGFPPLAPGNFRYDEAIGGGALFDAAGYPLRALHFLLGPQFKVAGASLYNDKQTGTNIFGSAYLKNDLGVGAHIDFGFDHFYQCNYELWGNAGKITALRAYTPAPDFTPTIILEQNGKSETLVQPACNHFTEAMREFSAIIVDTTLREKHYNDILLQSESLESIKKLSQIS